MTRRKRITAAQVSGEILMRKHLLKLASLLSVALAVALFAPQRAAADDDDDPPSRVARLSYTHGAVSFNPAGTDDWVSAVVNRPITTGDKLWTDNGSRAELHIGSAAIRLSGNTGFSFLNLDDRMAQIRITEGTLNVRVRRLENDETFEIDTPNLAFTVLRPGNYKIDVNEAGDSTFIVVRDGQGEVTGGGSAYTVHSRETGMFAGIDQLDADIRRFGEDEDDFDHWCRDRDRREDHSESARYVSSDVIGYEDLDEYGGWRQVPEYGTVWFPHTTIVGWAPYRYGHWVWISPWGWTWVDDAPWGFAPFHYGRWVAVRGVWGWVPCAPRAVVGVAYVRPVYAPALVAWVGGPHFSVGIGVGGGGGVGVGWFPLAPREVYVPSYRVSRTYVNNVNVSNTTVNTTVVNNYYNTVVVNKNVTNVRYVNQTAPNAVTVTSHETFTSAQPVGRNMMRIDRREIETAQVVPTTPTVAPQQRSVIGAGAPVAARPPARFQERPVVAKTPPPPAPVSFVKQQQEIRENGGRPPAVSEMRRARMEDAQDRHSNIKIAPPVQPGTQRNVQANRPADNAPNNPANGPSNERNNPGNRQDNPRNARNEDNRPQSMNNAPSNQPGNSGNAPGNSGNAPGNSGNAPGNPRNVQNDNNRPTSVNNAPSNQPGNSGNAPGNSSNAPGNSGNAPAYGRNNPGNTKVYNDRPPSSRPSNSNRPDDVNPQLDQKHQQQLEQLRMKQDQERQKVEQKQIKEQQKIQQNNPDDSRRQRVDQNQPPQRQQVDQKPQQDQPQRVQQNNADDSRRQKVDQNQPPQRQQVDQKPPQQDQPQRVQQNNADDSRRQKVEQKQQQQLQQLEQKHDQQQQKLQQKQQQESQKAKPADKPAKEDKKPPKDEKKPPQHG
jgi:hypothetical protein